jgi:hypothetical protein
VVGPGKPGRPRLFGVSPRKRRDHGDDAPLGLGAAPGTRRGSVLAGHWRTLTVLAPKLEPGHIVILYSLGAHRVPAVRPLIESRGAQLLYLSA